MRFESDEIGIQVSDVPVPVPITQDAINEAREELFVVHLTLGESMNAGGVNIIREVSLCRITDDDGECRYIKFVDSYQFMPP